MYLILSLLMLKFVAPHLYRVKPVDSVLFGCYILLHGGHQLHQLRTLHLFAGAGGGMLADLLLGHVPVGAVEIDPYCRQVLHARQQDGALPWFPIFDDVTTFDGRRYRGLADIVAGGFP